MNGRKREYPTQYRASTDDSARFKTKKCDDSTQEDDD